ncbi:MAG: histidinol-phosphate transaminase [Candidatus Thioglobus sp.]|nr:histidinol-phosphate transaminase [Candidatus Thioglobus sp.]
MNICPAIKSLKAYQGGKPISELQRELGLENIIKLASNESPLPVSHKVLRAISAAATKLNYYPDGNGFELKSALSKHTKMPAECITLGNGSNDLLELIARLCVCQPADEVIFSEYAFVVYPLLTQALGAKAVITKTLNFGHNLEAMAAAISAKTKLIFIANPNNPTGTFLSDEAIYSFLSATPKRVLVVLDQAYFEYLQIEDKACEWLAEFDNLIITRTFSKAYGLAGLRVGYALSNAKLADYLNRIRQPFNVNNIAQSAALAALNDKEFLQESVAANKNGLAQLASGFDELGLKYITSFANFIAVEIPDAARVYQQLLAQGFIVRPVEMKNYLRISVGTIRQNELFLQALKTIL